MPEVDLHRFTGEEKQLLFINSYHMNSMISHLKDILDPLKMQFYKNQGLGQALVQDPRLTYFKWFWGKNETTQQT